MKSPIIQTTESVVQGTISRSPTINHSHRTVRVVAWLDAGTELPLYPRGAPAPATLEEWLVSSVVPVIFWLMFIRVGLSLGPTKVCHKPTLGGTARNVTLTHVRLFVFTNRTNCQ